MESAPCYIKRGPIRASGGLRTSLVWISKPVVSRIEEEAWFRCWYFSIVFSLFSVAVAVSTHLCTSWPQNCCKNLIPDPVIFLNPRFNLGWINSEYFIKTEKKCCSLLFPLQLVTLFTDWRIKVGSTLFFRFIIISIHLRALITIYLVMNY